MVVSGVRVLKGHWIRCVYAAFGLVVFAPGTGVAASGAQDVANAVLAQVAAGLPALVKGKGDLSAATNVAMLQAIATEPFDTVSDLSSTLQLPVDASLVKAFADDGIDASDPVGSGSVYWVKSANIGAATWQEGTADCDSWEFFPHVAGAPYRRRRRRC